jgi:hypothetical protein
LRFRFALLFCRAQTFFLMVQYSKNRKRKSYAGQPVTPLKMQRVGYGRTGLPKSYVRPVLPRYRAPRMNFRTGGFLGLELKFLDCYWNDVSIGVSTDGSGGELQPTGGCTDCISMPAQGDGEQQRDGRKFTIKSVWVSGTVYRGLQQDQADVTSTSGIYFALVLDTQANGATIVSEDMFINPTNSGRGMLPQPLRNLQNTRRFKILASQYIAPPMPVTGSDGANTISTNAGQEQTVNLSWKGEIVCNTKGTTADVANATDNAIHVIAYGGGRFDDYFVGKSRVRFMG